MNIYNISQKDLELCITQKFKDIVTTLKSAKLFDGHGVAQIVTQAVMETVTEGDNGVDGVGTAAGDAVVVAANVKKEGPSAFMKQS